MRILTACRGLDIRIMGYRLVQVVRLNNQADIPTTMADILPDQIFPEVTTPTAMLLSTLRSSTHHMGSLYSSHRWLRLKQDIPIRKRTISQQLDNRTPNGLG